MNETVIIVKSVSKAFDTRRVLKDITINIDTAQAVLVCGINGAGKTTLLRIMAGLLQPDHGSVEICRYNIRKEPEKAKSKFGMISHKSMVYPDLTVLENLSFFANLYGVKDSDTHITNLLRDLGLSSYRYDKAGVLSRGLLQRLAIARAIIHRPAVLLADEPFTGLDDEACRHLINSLNEFKKNGGTIVMTTHDMDIGLQCCNRVVVLDNSNLIFDAENSDINTEAFSKDYLSYARGKT
ncbi:MAG: heme ABC exporter ATP-binding protein CcmA [Sedimentisphaerales bacterium]|nr:heme ABC exporter ATP-binding protein CcmA [Sedimentisphaerales bacterium]